MKASELPGALRALADRIEAANIPDGVARPRIDIYVHGPICDRKELAAWAGVLLDPIPKGAIDGSNYWIGERNNPECEIIVFYERGLMGQVRTEKVVLVEDTEDLGSLLAESQQPAEATA